MFRNVRRSRGWLRVGAVLASTGLGCLGVVVVTTAPAYAAGGSYSVTSTGDQDDISPGDGLCVSSGGLCTLRAAIAEANRDGGPSTINFAIPGVGPQTITIGSNMSIYEGAGPTTIDGYSQPTASPNTDPLVDNAQLRIQITSTLTKTGNGASPAVNGLNGFDIYSPGNVIRGIAFYNLRLAVDIHGMPNNEVVGNFIGTNAAGTYRDTVTNSNTFGVVIEGEGANNNLIGKPNLADRNVVSGNSGRAVYLNNYIGGNKIQNNIVGLTPDGTAALGNTDHGIDVNGGSNHTLIGGTGALEGNLISGNDGHGVEISHNPGNTTDANQIIGNRFGTDPTGNSGPAYAQNGVRYGHEEVHTEDHVTNTEISYNVIGNSPLGGIKVDSFSGGTAIHDNKIGISANGSSIPAGPYGIQIEEGSHGTIVGPNNVITNNRVGIRLQDGVTGLCMQQTGCPTQNNTITRNSIYGNTRLGIDIAPLDVVNSASQNSTTNGGILAPVLSAATATTVSGQTCANCRVELFVADGTTTDPSLESSYGEGKTFLVAGNADGSGTFTLRVPAAGANRFITSTVTDTAANTSEFSRNIVVPASTDLLNDAFGRTLDAGWGTADKGGDYTPASDPTSFAVNGSQGTIAVPTATARQIDALGVTAADVNLVATMTTDHKPIDGDHAMSLVARRQNADLMYRAGIRIDSAGSVYVRADAGVTLLGEQVLGFVYDGSPIRVRAQITGASPTTIKIKAWPVASTEPSSWALTVSDATAGLQQGGSIGIRATSTEASGPLVVSVDDFVATAVPAPK